MKKLLLLFFISFAAMVAAHGSVWAAEGITVAIHPSTLQADMGDKITYAGIITNESDKPASNLIAYISLANVTPGKEAPMDLEDWSANRAIKIDNIPPHGTYEEKWPMRLIDSGSYVAYITVVDKASNIPISSTMSHLEVRRIIRLNPKNILPVAIGEPLLIGIAFLFIAFKRRKR